MPEAGKEHIWLSKDTLEKIEYNLGVPGVRRCCVCHYNCKVGKRHVFHVRRHFVRYYCACGFHHTRKNAVEAHQKEKAEQPSHPNDKLVYEVDKDSYQAWAKHVNLSLPNPKKKLKKQKKAPVKKLLDINEDIDWRTAGRLRSSTKLAKLASNMEIEEKEMRSRIRMLNEQEAALRQVANRMDEVLAILQAELDRHEGVAEEELDVEHDNMFD